jgi:SAM-dependent methyltransferase
MTADQRPDDPARFDRDYYGRFYGDKGVHDRERIAHLATAVHEMAAWWGTPIRSVLDVGAGTGMWRDWYRVAHPEVAVRSIDVSEYACATWGHERLDIADWRPTSTFDLVVCHSVLQYLADDAAMQAIDHLGAATTQVLYLEAPTTTDVLDMVDRERTDLQIFLRSGDWYRGLLRRHFRQVGAGMWVPLLGVPMYELEAAPS